MYITVETLAKSFSYSTLVQLSNDEHIAAEINEEVVKQAILIASERIDAALRGRYRLPLGQVPTVISGYCLTLARYWLYARRPEGRAMPETVKDTYTQAIKELDQIANGKLHLGIAGFSGSDTATASQTASDYGDLLADSGEYRVKSANRMNTEGY